MTIYALDAAVLLSFIAFGFWLNGVVGAVAWAMLIIVPWVIGHFTGWAIRKAMKWDRS